MNSHCSKNVVFNEVHLSLLKYMKMSLHLSPEFTFSSEGSDFCDSTTRLAIETMDLRNFVPQQTFAEAGRLPFIRDAFEPVHSCLFGDV